MKRCPKCNRVEGDDALAYCRVDGTVLITDSGKVSDQVGTARLGSAPVSSEVQTDILPHRTEADASHQIAPATGLPPATASSPFHAASRLAT